MSWLRSKLEEESGAAVASAMLVLLLLAAITAGFTALVITDNKVRSMDGTRTQAFYLANAGLEKLTADLGDLFNANFAPTGVQITAVANNPPSLGVQWLQPDGTDGYTTTFPKDGSGNPVATQMTVTTGPFQGLVGLATPYQMTATARLPDGSEASLTRTLQTVAIPVFQFGMFSENDLSFFPGPVFNFGGRVHTNQNLYVASGTTLTLADRVTAVGEVIRTTLSNGWLTSSGYPGDVSIVKAPNAFRDLDTDEGSLVGGIGSARNEPTWTNLSTSTYNHNLMNSRTGAKRLDLPVTNFGATPIDLIRRPLPAENVNNPNVLSERFYTLASLRILLSDTAADISGLPGVTATAPVPLGNLALTPVAGYAITAATPPFGIMPVAGTLGARTPSNTPVMGGFIKIEKQNSANVWSDVTLEILNLGIAGKQLPDPNTSAPTCAVPNPNAIIRLERLRDNATCFTSNAELTTATNYIPNVLYDTREGVLRDGLAAAAPIQFGGIMHYIELDATNLSRWFKGQIGTTGSAALNVNGFTVYFSDRRGNRNGLNQETGEYGNEDIVNPASGTGTPNGILDVGEDFNGNGVLDTYGQTPRLIGGMLAPLVAAARPWTNVDPTAIYSQAEEIAIAERNPAIFFRRALKLTNGSLGNIVTPGLTIASENPVYIQGNWNANAAGFGNPHAATAVLADSVTLLSNAWNDRKSLVSPHDLGARLATDTWYRVAVLAGKGLSFPHLINTFQDYGTDGGAHNFLRYLENWDNQTLNYRGSIASMFISRQATGTYKCCDDVYTPPTRGYNFDVEFLTPSLLPPRTPMFRDVNTTGFAQLIRAK